jgi:hypothetical protein
LKKSLFIPILLLVIISSCTKEEEPINEACPEIYMPVCGPDGTQYDNGCFARLEGVTVYTGCGLTG